MSVTIRSEETQSPEQRGDTVLVTGAAGFIGMHVSRRLLDEGYSVVGIDNLNDYYDVQLKRDRLAQLASHSGFRFIALDIAARPEMAALFAEGGYRYVVHLAAQAGVRYSVEHPHVYADSNLVGFLNVLEGCRHQGVEHLVYASSSSVYGANAQMPFSTHHGVNHPVSLYAATKKANELMAHTYSHLYNLRTTGLRFFTVYGPWGRPDMSYSLFVKAILAGEPIKVFNNGRMRRDFTYIDDVVEGVVRVMRHLPVPDTTWDAHAPDPATSYAPYRLYNVGCHQPVDLMEYIEAIEAALGVPAIKEMLPMQPGDVPVTSADVDDLAQAVGFCPTVPVAEGVRHFVEWYRAYHYGKQPAAGVTA